MMSYKVKDKLARKHKLVLIVAVVGAVVLLACSYYFLRVRNDVPTVDPSKPDNTETINLDPPTKAELNETEKFKQGLSNNSTDSSASSQSSQAQSVTPIIGYLQQSTDGNIESNGHIPGAVAANGTCTLVLEKDGVKVSESRQTMMDAQGIICGRIVINRDKLDTGLWKAYISYDSSTQKGISETKSIEVK